MLIDDEILRSHMSIRLVCSFILMPTLSPTQTISNSLLESPGEAFVLISLINVFSFQDK